ncbi:hypothetical protein FQ085_11585 [Planococcus sp. ANT_H30]|uniref:hypothetical protein n=1 Tax=Planococcus sp. ANT_H30 TaxID=2597347 RepID=UPI0011EC837F|nr:hypothetical protein [Planococcus sp. ANT_H30]KAA0956628.1 hypothetical protein FQ085_11585 [Planococcus sp. ANT_H30]
MIDAAYHLQVYDADVIFSWSPREFKNFVKGAQLRRIDEFEMSAVQAMFGAKANNAKRLKLKDLYDSDKARKDLEGGNNAKGETLNLERYRKAQAAMKSYRPQQLEKGG